MKESSPDIGVIAADLHSIAIRLLRQVRQEDDALGLTSARLSALSVLAFGGRMTLGELASSERVSLPTMTRIAAALGKAGYVKRIADSDDRRYVYLEATPRGMALLHEGRRRRLNRLVNLLSGLDESQRHDCARGLSIIANALIQKTNDV